MQGSLGISGLLVCDVRAYLLIDWIVTINAFVIDL